MTVQRYKSIITLGITSLLVGSLAGCADSSSSSAPVKVNINEEPNPYSYLPDQPATHTFVYVRATEDQVATKQVVINRGNSCKIESWFNTGNSMPLKFGDQLKGFVNCDPDQIQEVTVITDKDTYTFNF